MQEKALLLVSREVNLSDIAFLPNNLLKTFRGLSFEISREIIELPSYAYNSMRKQYNSTLLLKHIARVKPKGYSKCLGIVDVDIYVEGLNFVFGEAILNGGEAIVSLHRLKPEFYGDPANEKLLFKERILKEVVHELGHTFGLTHCLNPKCVMHFSNSIIDTDFKSDRLCSACQTKLFSIL